jgi:hypothetical protein
MAAAILCACLAVAVLAPGTTIGRLLRELLIDLPARKLNQVKALHLAAGVAALGVAVAVVVYARVEGAMVLAQGVPEGLVWFATFDVATYVDAIALLALLAATVRLRAAFGALRASGERAKQGVQRFIAILRTRSNARMNRLAGRRRDTRPTSLSDEDRAWQGLAIA